MNKNIRILLIGDPHFKERGITRYIQMSQEIISHATRIKPDLIVILGDTLHKHESAHVEAFRMACQMILDLSRIAFTALLIGNHDYCNNQQYLSDKHFFNLFKEIPNILVVDEPIRREILSFSFIFCPYVYPGRFHEALAMRFTVEEIKKQDLIFGHQEILGVQMGSIKSEIGDPWPNDYPLLISGHIHEYNELQDNMIYVGTPIQHNFGDSPNKGIYLLTLDEENYEFERLPLNVILKKVIRTTAEKIGTVKIPKGAEVKIIIRCTIAEYNKLEKEGILESLKNKGAIVVHEEAIMNNIVIEDEIQESFLESLKKKISHDNDLLDRYNAIFFS